MGMNSVDGLAPQQQVQAQVGNAATPLAVAGGIGLGGIGATAGYFIGNKRPDLEKVFTQAPDTFKTEAVTKKDADAARTLQEAATEYRNAGKAERNALNKAVLDCHNSMKAQTIDNRAKLEKAITDAKDAYFNKEVEIDGNKMTANDVASELKAAREEVKAAKNADDATKATAIENYRKAKANADAFNNGAQKERNAFMEARKKLSDALDKKFIEKVGDEKSVEKALADKLIKATDDFDEVKANKLKELLGKKEVTEAFEKIKKAIPKEGGARMALIVGGIAAAVGAIGGLILGGSTKKQA